ncbi:MAG: methyltransferase, TIGR04325 family [Actinomycetota bacterium]|nr:methyltransferase, TIGR04325 family [Actinomycetota bacterium]
MRARPPGRLLLSESVRAAGGTYLRHRRYRGKGYRSYDEAIIDCHSQGYGQEQLAQIVCEKTRRYRDELEAVPVTADLATTAMLLALEHAMAQLDGSRALRVLDFGGGGGVLYWLVRRYLPAAARLEWSVVETKTMAAAAVSALAGEEIRFFASIAEAITEGGPPDLVHSSSALQYVPDPRGLARAFLDTQVPVLLLTRLALAVDGDDVTVVQSSRLSDNGPGPLPLGVRDRVVKYPVTFVTKSWLEQTLAQRYVIRARFDGPTPPWRVQGRMIGEFGYLACDERARS